MKTTDATQKTYGSVFNITISKDSRWKWLRWVLFPKPLVSSRGNTPYRRLDYIIFAFMLNFQFWYQYFQLKNQLLELKKMPVFHCLCILNNSQSNQKFFTLIAIFFVVLWHSPQTNKSLVKKHNLPTSKYQNTASRPIFLVVFSLIFYASSRNCTCKFRCNRNIRKKDLCLPVFTCVFSLTQ